MSTLDHSAAGGAAAGDRTTAGSVAWLALVQTYGHVSKLLDRELTRELGFSLAWFEVLIRLNAAEGGRIRLTDLTRQLVVSKASVTRLIDRMEAAGKVRREVPADDRRGVYAIITPAGRAALADALPLQAARLRATFTDHLTDSDLEDLNRILEKVLRRHGSSADHSA